LGYSISSLCRSGTGKEQFGNLIGIPSVCPLGYRHYGAGYCTYSGQFQAGLFCGRGEFVCQSGPRYSGEWKMGRRSGQGEMHYLKEGELGDEQRLCVGGVGSLYRAASYRGAWVDDVRTGHGVLTYTNGDTLEGHFLHGQPHGVLLYTFHSTANSRAAAAAKKKKNNNNSSATATTAAAGEATGTGTGAGTGAGGGSKGKPRTRGARFERGERVEWIDEHSPLMKMLNAFHY
jgi:hypothetical protein